LRELKRKPKTITATEFEKREFYAQLKFWARNMNYKPGWAANQYREKFGVWPHDAWSDWIAEKPPTPETMGWIRAQQIRFRQARRKEERAA
jgi:hypothetical protein